MPLLVLYNPICGDGTAESFIDGFVIPLLHQHNKVIDKVASTENIGHAATIVVDFLESTQGEITVVLGSGDGTLHEIINELSRKPLVGLRVGLPPPKLHFVLVPCGTANALYSSFFPPADHILDASYRLQSITAFINDLDSLPLTLGIITLSSHPAQRKRPEVAVSAVVASTSLHASILHDSEDLRKEIPSIQRFKVAAEKNISRWYHAYVKLLPAPSAGVVEIYDPYSKTFVSHPDSYNDDPIVDVDGPFVYFLSTVNVDRLEPNFRIAPLYTIFPPKEATFDIVMVRPLRDPSLALDSPEARGEFAAKTSLILSAAYNDGIHVDFSYDANGVIKSALVGPTVVEYVRCGGFEWIPDDLDDAAHFLCSDGAILEIEKGGRAVCSAARPDGRNSGFMLYA